MKAKKKVVSRLLTAEEVSTLLHIPKSTLYKLCHEGEIPAARIGKHWRFDRARVDQWLLEQFEAQQSKGAEKVGDSMDVEPDASPLTSSQIKSKHEQ